MDFEVLSTAIMNVLHVYIGEIVPEAMFKEDFGADSIDLYQIYTHVEEELKIHVDLNKISNVKTVADALALIEEAKKE